MGKWANDAIMDAALNIVKVGAGSNGPADKQVVCSAQPATFAEANATYMLANVAMAGSDFTLADDASGRKNTVAAKSGIVIANSGTATHVALIDTVHSVLLYVTTCTSQALTANGSNTVSIPSWKFAIADPT